MNRKITRRQLLAAATAGGALAACDIKNPNPGTASANEAMVDPSPAARLTPVAAPNAQAPASAPAAGPGDWGAESKLFLPTTSGGAARVPFANTASWARDIPGWFIPCTVSAGSSLLAFPGLAHADAIVQLKTFRELPVLLQKARSLGTDVVYVVDWYEGLPGDRPGDYWKNKGDYIPRADLGGAAALADGISAVHAQGGRVILYTSGFNISRTSGVGTKYGADWAVMLKNGPLMHPYGAHSWMPCPATEGWQAWMEGVASRIGQYGADGMFLDSYGNQLGYHCVARNHGHPVGRAEVYTDGLVNTVRRIRAGLQRTRPEGVVLTEGLGIEGPGLMGGGGGVERMFQYTDGSFDWGIHTFVNRWCWDAQGQTDTIITGWSLDDWNQIVAIGAKLACPGHLLDVPPGASASAFLEEALKNGSSSGESDDDEEEGEEVKHHARRVFWGLNQWRNGGLIMGLRMPGFQDVFPNRVEFQAKIPNPNHGFYTNAGQFRAKVDSLRGRIATMDAAFAGKHPPSPAAYLKSLLTARAAVARVIDHGATVSKASSTARAVAWKFTGPGGTALTAVNVGDDAAEVSFPGVGGSWKDGVRGEGFAAQGNSLRVSVPAHGVRMLLPG